MIIATLRDAANTHEREISDKGVTVTVKDWTLDHDKVRLAELPYEL